MNLSILGFSSIDMQKVVGYNCSSALILVSLQLLKWALLNTIFSFFAC